jgi:hypothetical protein
MALNGFDGNGNFLRTFPEGGWKGDATAGIKIRADRHDDHDQAITNALSNMICKDGQTTVLADIPFNGKKITDLGTPTLPTDAVNKSYADSVNTFTVGAIISGADLNGRLTFSSPTGANGLAWTGADLSWLAKLSPNRLVLNDKADGTGTDKVVVGEDGTIVAASNITASGGGIIGGSSLALATAAAGGNIVLRPNGPADVTRQVSITGSNGRVVSGGDIFVVNGPSVGGLGTALSQGNITTSTNTTAAYNHHYFYTPSGLAGAIATSGLSTTYGTASSADLKDIGADYSAAEAIAIIRADPVKTFKWKATGDDGVGWIAQSSHAVRDDLAVHIPAQDADEKGEGATEEWWGIDYSRRTPYLWAALANALDRIDALEARLAALEAA